MMKPAGGDHQQPGMSVMGSGAGMPAAVDPPFARRRAGTGGAGPENGPLPAEERERIIRRLRWLARLLDDAVQIPGTNITIGLDGVVGLVPGIGDLVTFGLSAFIINEARRLGTPRHILALMVANVGIDLLVGAVPLVGDVADVMFKANRRNLKLLGIEPAMPGERV